MVREDTVTMSSKELRRVHVIRKVQDQQLTQGEAARLLGLTDRQIRRLMRRVEQEGDRGLVHLGPGETVEPEDPREEEGKGVAAVCAAV